jgi:phenylacetate-coenzyme A ligase PaaK-like adenylate-forming protein
MSLATKPHPVAPAAPFDPWQACAMAADVAAAVRENREALAARRAMRLKALLEAAAETPLYGPLLARRSAGAWRLEELPIARKAALMTRFDEWVADPRVRLADVRRFIADPRQIGAAYLGRYAVWESSGSSGEPGVFVVDPVALAVYDALEALRRHSPRPALRFVDPMYLSDRIAFVGAIGGHFASASSMARLRRLNPLMAPGLRSLSFLQPVEALDAELDAFDPTILSTYPSAAVILAEERLAGRLNIAPREIWTGGETLTPSMRSFLHEAFRCPVSNDYGASEFLALGSECALGRLHANTDWAILESVDDEGRPVPVGEQGARCLLTNLANRVQPLIRYDLGDRLRIHERACACGSPFPVIDVRGRTDDTLHLGIGKDVVRLSPLAVSTVLEDDAGLFDFQLVQQGPRRLQLTTRLRGPAARACLQRGRDALLAFIADQGAQGVSIRCRSSEPIRQRDSGKIQRIVAAVR